MSFRIVVMSGMLEFRPNWSYEVVQIWPGWFVCKQVTVCPGHIWTTLYPTHYIMWRKASHPYGKLTHVLSSVVKVLDKNYNVNHSHVGYFSLQCKAVPEMHLPVCVMSDKITL
jgi:hypothetical protein